MKITPEEETSHLYQLGIDWLARISFCSVAEIQQVRIRLQNGAGIADPEDKKALLLLDKICALYQEDAQ